MIGGSHDGDWFEMTDTRPYIEIIKNQPPIPIQISNSDSQDSQIISYEKEVYRHDEYSVGGRLINILVHEDLSTLQAFCLLLDGYKKGENKDMRLEPYQRRIINEKEDLDEKIGRLDKFLGGELYLTMPVNDQELLRHQALIMKQYSNILGTRIARFKKR